MLFGVCPHASHIPKLWPTYVITYSDFMVIVKPWNTDSWVTWGISLLKTPCIKSCLMHKVLVMFSSILTFRMRTLLTEMYNCPLSSSPLYFIWCIQMHLILVVVQEKLCPFHSQLIAGFHHLAYCSVPFYICRWLYLILKLMLLCTIHCCLSA